MRGEFVLLGPAWLALREHSDYPPAVRNLLGEAVVASVLLASTLKFEGELTLQMQGNGAVRLLVAQCTNDFKVRAVARFDAARFPEGDSAMEFATLAGEGTIAARKQWLADHLQVRGQVTLDAGAVKALTVDGKSLLPVGVISASGSFGRGEVVSCLDEQGREIARGLVNYGHGETCRILRTPSSQIEEKLGYVDEPELIHRDNLVLL